MKKKNIFNFKMQNEVGVKETLFIENIFYTNTIISSKPQQLCFESKYSACHFHQVKK